MKEVVCFKEVPGFPLSGYDPRDQWMVNFRQWYPFIMIVFISFIQHGFLPGWFSPIVSISLISSSIFTLFVIWYIIFFSTVFKSFLNNVIILRQKNIFEFVGSIILSYILWNEHWLWTFIFYCFSLCNIIGFVLFFESKRLLQEQNNKSNHF